MNPKIKGQYFLPASTNLTKIIEDYSADLEKAQALLQPFVLNNCLDTKGNVCRQLAFKIMLLSNKHNIDS